MSRFDQLQAQIDGAQTPPAVSPTVEQAPPMGTPVADDLSLLERWSESTAAAGSKMADTMAFATGLDQEQQQMLGATSMETGKYDPTMGQVAMQVAGGPVEMVWDWGSDVLIEAGQEGISLLPNSVREGGTEAVKALVESPVGQHGLSAWQAGKGAWDTFAAKFPQEARTLSAGLNLIPGGKAMGKIPVPTELTPLKLNKTGLRKELQAPQGRDKDIYNLILPEQTKKQKLTQVQEGRVTDPRGVTGQQKVVPSEQEWKIVDEMKTLDVSANKTYQQNANIVQKQIDTLNEQTRRKAAGTKGGVDHDVVVENIRQDLAQRIQQNPGIFGADGKKAQKTIEDVLAQLEKSMDSNGTSWEGLLRSRQELDNFLLNQLQIGTYGTGRKAGAVTEAHKAIRETINGYVKNNVEGSGKLLERQSLLFGGLDGLGVKAADEASSSLGRLLREINMHNPTTPLAQMSTLLSPLVWAGAVAVSPFVLANKARRGVLQIPMAAEGRGYINQGIRDVINESQKALKIIKDPTVRKQMQTDIKVLATLLHTIPPETDTAEGEQ